MKKQHLDFLYDLRQKVVADINRLVEIGNLPVPPDAVIAGDTRLAELRTRRSQLGIIDDIIEHYIATHSGG